MDNQASEVAPGHVSLRVTRSTDQSAYLELTLATFFWAGVFVFGKQSLAVVDPVFLAWARFAVAASVIATWFTATRRWRFRSIGTLFRFAWLGLLGVFGYNVLFLLALKMSTPLHGLVIIATTPAWTTMLSAVVLGTRVRGGELVGIATAFAAVLLVVLGPANGGGRGGDDLLTGDGLFVAAAVVWAIYSIETRKVMKATAASPDEATGWGLIFGALMLTPMAVSVSDIARQIDRIRFFDAATIVYIGVCGTVLAFLFWSDGLKKIGPARTSVFLNLVPIWGTILSAVLLQSWPSSTTFAALILAISGVVITQRSSA